MTMSADGDRAGVGSREGQSVGHFAARFGVQGIPNFVVLKDGRAVFQQAGVVPAQQMRHWLEQAGA